MALFRYLLVMIIFFGSGANSNVLEMVNHYEKNSLYFL
jgi:hypothetical protein